MTDRSNILLISTDQWPGRVMGYAGHPAVMTPTLDSLARIGTYYTNAYSTCPSCIPARRSLMTGMTPRSHGDRTFREKEPMPDAPTLAGRLGQAGYQTNAVGKLHVYPQRHRIGFDDVILNEEGRQHLGEFTDDWEQYLADQGFAGQGSAGGLCNNEYFTRAWHLPEHCHPTNWASRQMCRTIHRRDPTRPSFWYLSFIGPHPPISPLQTYIDQYRDLPIDQPVYGDWSRDPKQRPSMFNTYFGGGYGMSIASPEVIDLARRYYYATLTHIDHQVRLVLGTLREAGILDDTAIIFCSDHGDMLGDHGRWAKTLMYDMSAKIPLIVVPPANTASSYRRGADGRLATLEDIPSTLLEFANVPAPTSFEGRSLLSGECREYVYAEHWEGPHASRMVRDDRYKLIYYPSGNLFQLFDLIDDPRERHNLIESAKVVSRREKLTSLLRQSLYGSDLSWCDGDQFVGLPAITKEYVESTGLSGQRGLRF